MSINNVDKTITNISTIESELLNSNNVRFYHEEIVKPRLILQSNEKKRFKLRYCPIEMGDHRQSYTFSIVDNPHTTYHIEVNGIASIPRLDMNPYIIFEKIMEKKIDETNEPSFILDDGIFDFGSLVLLKKEKRSYHSAVKFTLRNITPIEAEVSLCFNDSNANEFNVQPETLIIPPYENRKVTISAEINKLGPFYNKLYICTKNNPRIDMIELRCYGIKLEVELDEKQLSFGRVLLYRKVDHFTTIRNRSTVPIFWRIECKEPFEAQITFNPKENLLLPLKEQRIEFSYDASTIGIIEKKMDFQIFLHEDDEDPVNTDIITIFAETYDVLVDINYANPIDLKFVKVDHPVNAHFDIKNRGNYEIQYTINFNDNAKLNNNVARPTNVKKNLEINPVIGTIQPQKTITVEMTFLPKNEIHLMEAPILICHILDPNQQPMIVAELPLTVSLQAYYNRFNINPYSEINFGMIPICTKKIMNLDIENTGVVKFHYIIHIPAKSMFLPVSVIKEERTKKLNTGRDTEILSKREKKSMKTEKTDMNVKSTLNIGPFTLMKIEADVDAGQTDTIVIECYPEIVGSQEEQIIVFVPDTVMEYKDGKKLVLRVESSIPLIDFTNLDNMFRSNHIVDNIEDFLCPKEIGAHTVFARQPKCLHFRRVTMSNAYTTCFEVHNRGIIPADIIVKAFVKRPSNVKATTFIVEPQKERIPAHSYKRINITFSPALIETYYGYLEISLNLPVHINTEKLMIDLIGEACVPEITITEPTIGGVHDRPIIRFHRTLVEETSIEKFSFENIGFVKANVIVEIYDDPNSIFSFSATPDTQTLLRTTDYEDDVRDKRCFTVVIRMMPQDVASFEVMFSPKYIGKYTGRIRLFIVDNPYDNLTIDLEGESFLESIVLQDLEFLNFMSNNRRELNSKKNKLSSSSLTDTTPPVFLSYKLDYGTCQINKMYKRTFKIVNKTLDRCFRFQWTAHPNVVFEPSIGHLQHSTSKQVTATLLESEPKRHDVTRLECVVSQIEISNYTGENSWDDRQTIVRWEKIDIADSNKEDSLSKKNVEPTNEPEHATIPGTTRCILLLINAIIGFSEYSCSTTSIDFKDTLMFQKREYTFTLSNPSDVNTDYVWMINMDEEYPKRISGSTIRLSEKSKSCEFRSRSGSKSSRGVLYPTEKNDNNNLRLHRCKPLPSHGERNRFFFKITTFMSQIEIAKSLSNQKQPFLDIKPRPCTCKESDLYSSTACLTDRSTDSWLEGEDLPFEIVPRSGTMLPGESLECTLTFLPRDVFDYKAYLNCKIENLNPKLTELVIPIKARSILPYCHFDVPESDYISSGKRDRKLPGPIGYSMTDVIVENIRVIELNVIGIGNVHTKRFPMINPTADNYHFSWKNHTPYSINEVTNFQCLVSEGVAERGKQTEMAFTFLSTDVGTFESFWMFSIKKYDLKCLFLFVAIVKEPVVYCTRPYLKMKPTLLDLEVQDSVSIINKENFDISFKISEGSLYSEGHYQNIIVTPMNGVLKANDEQTFWINYKPKLVGEFHFSVQCILKFLRNPLIFFITTTTYDIMPCITYINKKDEDIRLLDHQDNIIDFGKIIPKRSNIIRFKIINSGNVTFYYTWDLGMTPEIISMNAYVISISERKGHVTSESHTTCCLTLMAKRKMFIKNHCVILKISKGPTYRLILKAIACKAPIEFSFRQYNFGPCYVRESSPYQTELRVSNTGNKPLILECKFEERPHMSINLNELSQILAGKSSISIPIKFRPMQEINYEEILTFLINSAVEENVKITGEGISYKIRLVNSHDKIIELGNVPVHKTLIKKVPVINEGRAPVDLKFDLMSNLLQDKRYVEKIPTCIPKSYEEIIKYQEYVSMLKSKIFNEDDKNLRMDMTYAAQALIIEPSNMTQVRTNEKIDLTIKFKATSRINMFTQQIGAMVDSTIFSLFILRGSCVGPEFRLDKTYIAFGTVIQGCISETKLILMNIGEVGGKFTWDTSNLPIDFKISPKSGYSSPGTNVHFIVKFEPIHERNVIEGYAENVIEKLDTLKIKITGACKKLPDPIETLSFKTFVRSKESKSINVFNDTVLPWKLKPEISGEHFYVDNILNIPPEESTSCTVIYQPLVMNTEDNLHKGILLIKLPDNKIPLLYSLHGLSLPPQAISTIVRQFPAKMKYTELLPVYNWKNRHQQFKCIIETIGEKKLYLQGSNNIPIFSFTGDNNINVPSNNQRDYRAIFHSYKESYFQFKITFINEDGEYQFYEVQYTITKPEVIESIKLITDVRSSACHTLQLYNPLENIPVTFTFNCRHPAITIYDIPITVSPLSNGFITINYNPILTSEEMIEKLDINCQELGCFPYELRLTALLPAAEKTTHVTATLGNTVKFSLSIRNFTLKKADFVIEVNNDSFICPKKIELERLEKGSIDVIYEPHDIENITTILTATSKTAGIFTYPIIGTYSLPKPQGPYTMTANSPVMIKFKNIFEETKTFEFLANSNLDFEIKPTSQDINPKQEINVIVNLRHTDETEFYEKCPVTGKLSVHCTDPRLSHVIWIYYLRGIIE
ncbi:hydrocephalus-inducing protein-like [Vespa crabro]|uniref:hydrocephalus-inducing protein-like n=1 Tax=Vespa crabro TaxID=7445 RepID=UPI001F0068B2|nr:hydrocephalus-inducing protein-like [Vespa crabro]